MINKNYNSRDIKELLVKNNFKQVYKSKMILRNLLNIFIKIRFIVLISEKKISIIITSYNKEKFIQNTIKSCIDQNYKNYEIIIIDTGSKDKTKYLINKFSNKLIKKILLKKIFNSIKKSNTCH